MKALNSLLNPWFIFLMWVALWVARLRLIPLYFERTLVIGYYPPEADSIAIPIAGNIVATLVGAPIFALVLWLLLRGSVSERRTWLVWCPSRWAWSLFWTFLFAAGTFASFQSFIESLRIHLPLNALADLGWCFLWLALRAIVVSRLSP